MKQKMTFAPNPPEPDHVPSVIRLTGHATTATAEDLRSKLVLASDCAGTSIDASEIYSVGQAVLQVLVAARNNALRHGQPFHFTATSDAFADRVACCLLAELIGMDAGRETAQ
jgi:anti-anti-sigma regulatory factor